MVRRAFRPTTGCRFFSLFKSLCVSSSFGTSKGTPAIDNMLWLSGSVIFRLPAMYS
jgi:hypothetical protein